MDFTTDITKAVLVIYPAQFSPERASHVRHALFDAGFILVREETRDINAETAEKICLGDAAANRSQLVGAAHVMVVARNKAAEELVAFVEKNELFDVAYCNPKAANASRAVLVLFPKMMVDPIPTNAEARSYVQDELRNVLIAGLSELAKKKPHNSVEWLAHYLLEHNPRSPPVTSTA